MREKQLWHWKQEKKLIPVMIRIYCHGNHGTKGREVCDACRKLTGYALDRLEKCPFKVNKKFCSFCMIHCYRTECREEIKAVMRYAGPRMLPVHPVFAVSHVIQKRKFVTMPDEKTFSDFRKAHVK